MLLSSLQMNLVVSTHLMGKSLIRDKEKKICILEMECELVREKEV